LYHYGFNLYALIFEGVPVLIYVPWVLSGPVRDDTTYNPADDPEA
jgi:hypothetical protein